MGKVRRNRAQTARHNPTGSVSVNSEEDAELNGSVSSRSRRETQLQNVTEQLQSPKNDQKLCGLHRLAEIFDGQTLDQVARDKIVRIVGPLLVDESPVIRNSAAGTLRNLSVNGGPEFCETLVEQDIMTPLCTLLHKFGDSWQPTSDTDDDDADTFIQAVNLLWNLCECNETAMKYFNQSSLLRILVRCLDVKAFGMEVVLAVAECLHTVTEDNQEVNSQLQESGIQLQNFLSADGDDVEVTLLRVLMAGVTLNLSQGGVPALDPSVLALVMAAISSALTCDHRQALNQLTSELELSIKSKAMKSRKMRDEPPSDEEMEDEAEETSEMEATSKNRGKETKEDVVNKMKKDLKLIARASRLLEAQKVALEILANLCSGEDDDDEVNDDDSDSEEMSDSSMADDSGTQERVPLNISSDVLEAIVSFRLVTKVWDKTVLPAENVSDIIHEHPDCEHIVKRLNLLRSRAFLCLQNMVTVMDLEELGGCNDVYNMWLETGKLVFNKTKVDDVELLEAATSVMRAAVQRLAEAKASQFSTLSLNDLQMLLKGEQQSQDPSVRANLIRIIGSIGQMLAPSNSPHLPVIGKFLLDSASRDAELWVTAEALDCIFDVFGEDETDKAAHEIGLVDKLRMLVPQLKSKFRTQKKFLGDRCHIVMTANTNLNRFIKYKGKRLAVYASNGHH